MGLTASRAASQAWQGSEAPSRLLLIRLQALGDVVITLPYAQALRRSLPGTGIDFLTRGEDGDIPRAVRLFDEVFLVGGGRSASGQILHALRLLPALRRRRYDAVVDLQDNRVSRMVRRLLRPAAWSAFDRVSPTSHGERTRRAIEAAGFPVPEVRPGLVLRAPELGLGLLARAGWSPPQDLVVLNPAGAFPSRHWPVESYVAFARLWRERHAARFVVLGLPSLEPRVRPLRLALGADLIDLVGGTSAAEAFAIVARASLVLSEDSGLMHMAWVSGVPTLALFGSSRSDWSAPLGNFSVCLHSGDLACGACMEVECRFGDVRCLTRYSPERVLQEAEGLLGRVRGRERIIA